MDNDFYAEVAKIDQKVKERVEKLRLANDEDLADKVKSIQTEKSFQKKLLDNKYELDISLLDYCGFSGKPMDENFLKLLGKPKQLEIIYGKQLIDLMSLARIVELLGNDDFTRLVGKCETIEDILSHKSIEKFPEELEVLTVVHGKAVKDFLESESLQNLVKGRRLLDPLGSKKIIRFLGVSKLLEIICNEPEIIDKLEGLDNLYLNDLLMCLRKELDNPNKDIKKKFKYCLFFILHDCIETVNSHTNHFTSDDSGVKSVNNALIAGLKSARKVAGDTVYDVKVIMGLVN